MDYYGIHIHDKKSNYFGLAENGDEWRWSASQVLLCKRLRLHFPRQKEPYLSLPPGGQGEGNLFRARQGIRK
ncbi:MAG: hypothetical protein QNK37_18145 [Acidobacteriota bacterium]|nr:hypothetical protein [Acidobacteriota bacterium]